MRLATSKFIHIACWIFIIGFPLFFSQQVEGWDWASVSRHVSMPLLMCLLFYTNYAGFVPKLLFKGRNKEFLLYNLLLIIALCLLMRYWHEMMGFIPTGRLRRYKAQPYFLVVLRDVFSFAVCAGVSVAIRLSMRWQEAEMARKEAERSRTEAELKNLRSQLNPHFLLNTLNNIYALIAIDTDKAQEAVQELSKLLRYVLYENQTEFVPLHKEVDFIKHYIELMRIRMHKDVRIETDFQIKPESRTPIAPLIVISLIENAFKHGIAPTAPSYIGISIQEDEEKITVRIVNSHHPKMASDKSGSGIGLEQVSKRLELTYAGRYQWDKHVDEAKNEYQSTITIYHQRTP